jgi:hypothetical protein
MAARFDDYLRRRSGVTIGGNSMLGAAVLNSLNCVGFRNMTLHWLQAKNCVSYRLPFFLITLTR